MRVGVCAGPVVSSPRLMSDRKLKFQADKGHVIPDKRVSRGDGITCHDRKITRRIVFPSIEFPYRTDAQRCATTRNDARPPRSTLDLLEAVISATSHPPPSSMPL